MGLTNFPNGISSMGVPIPFGVFRKIFFVHSVSGSDGNTGLSTTKALATVNKAISLVTADKNDLIVLMSGHAEALTATSFVVGKAGVTIIGEGTGSLMPTFTTAVVGGVVEITAANAVVGNIKLLCNYTGGSTNAVTVAAGADYCTLDGIVARDTLNSKEWLIHVSVATTVTDLNIINCDFIGLTGGTGSNSILFAGTSSNVRILDNFIDADMSDSLIDHDADTALNILVARNYLLAADTDSSSSFCVELEASTTGHVIDNRSSYANTGAATLIGEGAFFIENFGGNTAGGSGELDPAGVAIP